MIRFVYGQDEEIREFVAKQAGVPRGLWPNSKAIGIVNDRGQFLAGVVYHHWSPDAGTIVMSGAATHPSWLNRTVLQRVFDFPFRECGCQMVLVQLRANDERLQGQLAAIGFGFDRIRRLYGRTEDGVIATMTDDDWAASRFNRGFDKLEEAA
jgi:RimJ/RimL family protein N-acetyltransferase